VPRRQAWEPRREEPDRGEEAERKEGVHAANFANA